MEMQGDERQSRLTVARLNPRPLPRTRNADQVDANDSSANKGAARKRHVPAASALEAILGLTSRSLINVSHSVAKAKCTFDGATGTPINSCTVRCSINSLRSIARMA